jgi:hypothetical protein
VKTPYCLDCCAEMRVLPHYRARAGLRPVIKRWDGDVPCFGSAADVTAAADAATTAAAVAVAAAATAATRDGVSGGGGGGGGEGEGAGGEGGVEGSGGGGGEGKLSAGAVTEGEGSGGRGGGAVGGGGAGDVGGVVNGHTAVPKVEAAEAAEEEAAPVVKMETETMKELEELDITEGVAGSVRSLPAAAQESRRAVVVKCPHCIEVADDALTGALEHRAAVEAAAADAVAAATAAAAAAADAADADANTVAAAAAADAADADMMTVTTTNAANKADANAKVAAAREKRRRAIESPLKLKVRCVSVTTKKSLAVAKAMPDPLDDMNGLAERYGGEAAPVGAYHLLTIVYSRYMSSSRLFYLLLPLKRPR